MTISEDQVQGKAYFGRIPADMLILLVLVLSSTLAFGLGILAGKDMAKTDGKDGFWIEQLPEESQKGGGGPAAAIQALAPAKAPEVPVEPEPQVYMASKNGTKYYLPTCGTAKRIKEENRIWFATKEEAEAAGYGPAANCPGL
jgi:hypothetical protein